MKCKIQLLNNDIPLLPNTKAIIVIFTVESTELGQIMLTLSRQTSSVFPNLNAKSLEQWICSTLLTRSLKSPQTLNGDKIKGLVIFA